MSRVLPLLLRLKGFFLDVLHPRCVRWTRPLTLSLPLGTLRDLGRSKSEIRSFLEYDLSQLFYFSLADDAV